MSQTQRSKLKLSKASHLVSARPPRDPEVTSAGCEGSDTRVGGLEFLHPSLDLGCGCIFFSYVGLPMLPGEPCLLQGRLQR